MINYACSSYTLTPPSAVANGYPRTLRFTLYNKQMCYAVQWWEKEVGCKFTGKIRSFTGDSMGYQATTHSVYLSFSDIYGLFHELQHFLQARQQPNTRMYNEWYKLYNEGKVNMFSYGRIYKEADANRAANKLFRKFCKERGLTH